MTYKKDSILCFTLTLLILFITTVQYVNADGMDLKCKSAILMDENTGTIVYEKNSHEKL